ncbi:Glutathione reductase [Venturia nashicola]|uniref:Glutathione reductase n=1 Tax=Venturia nashicola TaxID=86259 RepID=A0A4Z1PAM7_9PEZI|nr:Glutathione reductase [Venturia nashicola]
MTGNNPPKDAPPTEQQQEMANGTADKLADAATATQASEEENGEDLESKIARGNHIAHHETPPRLMSADSYYHHNYAKADEKRVAPATEPPIEQVPPPAYSSDVLGRVEEQGLGTNASVANDGRVNITIRSQKLSSLLVPALRNQQKIIAKEKPLPSPYIPPSLGGSPGELPPPPLNIVVMVVGSRGDVQPFLALGKVLKETYGHRVRLATHPTFKSFIEENGLEFFSIGGDPSELMAFMVKNPGLMPGFDTLRNGDVGKRRANIAGMIRGCWRACIEAGDGSGVEASDDAIGDWMTDDPISGGLADSPDDANPRPFVADAIIANPPSFAHVHCAERLGIPLHMMFTMPWSPTEAFPHPLANITSSNADQTVSNYITYALVDMLTWQGLGDIINRFRVHILGLEPISLVWGPGMLARLKVPYTYCWSPALIPKPNDWGSHISLSGFYFLEQASHFTPAPELKAFLDAGPPPVYIGFGSIVVDDPNAMTTMIFEAVKKSGQRALVSKGWGGFGADELGIPEGVFMLGNVPHDWLFQHVSCVVHHGGAGTTAAGIAAGKPTFVVPFFGDQPFWGSMVNRAGAGPPPVPYKDLTAESLAAGILECIKPSSQEKAKVMALKISKEKGTDAGAQSFHQMLDVDKMRCSVLPEQVAVWRVKRTQIRLSALAAYVLAEKSVISFGDLKLYRPREFEVEMGPTDPISGGASAVLETLTSTMMGVADFPVATLKALAIHPDSGKGKGKGKAKEGDDAPVETGSCAPLTATHSSTSVDQPRSSLSSEINGSTPATTPGTLTPVVSKESRPGDVLIRESSATSGGTLSTVTSGERTSRDSIRSPRGGSMAEALRNLPEGSRPRSLSRGRSGSSPHRRSGSITMKKPSHTNTWTEGTHSPGPDLLDTAYGTGKGISKISGSILKSPMDVLLGISKGFHNMPRLYGEEVRQTDRVTGIKSGFRVAGKELGLGFFDGITGLVTQPLQGAKKEGASGFVKGFGKGIAGLVVKPGAGIYGLPGYAMKGFYKEIQRHFGASANNYIIAARTAQGWEAWLQTDKDTQTEIVHRYLQVVDLVKKSDKKGGKEDQCEAVQEYIEKRKNRRREAWERFGKNLQTKKSAIQQNLQAHCQLNKDGKSASHSISDQLHAGMDDSSSTDTLRTKTTGRLPHAATFPAPSTHHQSDSDDDTKHDHDLDEAIRQSVMDSSTGNEEEDVLIHRAIQASMAELQQGQGPAKSTTTMGDTAEEEEQLMRAIEESMRSASGAHQSADEYEGKSSRIEMRDLDTGSSSQDHLPPPYEYDAPAVLPRSPRQSAVANQDIKGEPPSYEEEGGSTLYAPSDELAKASSSSDAEAAADDAEDEANLQRALEESMRQDEKSRRERTEEEIVMESVKKQSLLEEEERRRIAQGRDMVEEVSGSGGG